MYQAAAVSRAELEQRAGRAVEARRGRASGSRRSPSTASTSASAPPGPRGAPVAPTTTSTSAPGASGTHGDLAGDRAVAGDRRRRAARASRAGLDGPGGLDVARRLGGHVRGARARRRPAPRVGLAPPRSSRNVAGRWPSSGTPASTRPSSANTSMPSITPRPAPPASSEISRPGQPASTAVGHRSGSSPPSSASRAASTVLKRDSAPRAASLRNSCSSVSAKFTRIASRSLARSSENGMPLSSRGSGGRPSTRSPTMLRRISSVPPADFSPGRSETSSPQWSSESPSGPSTSTSSSPAAIAALIVVTLASAPSGPGMPPRCSVVSIR